MAENKKIKIKGSNAPLNMLNARKSFLNNFKNSPIPDDEVISNLGLFTNRQLISKIFFMNALYKKIINIHGIIIEFGVRWGQNLAFFESFRGIYEPYNFNRKIVGFDTFSGFNKTHIKDGKDSIISKGSFGVTRGYEKYLEKILDYHETESPYAHIKKYELIKGDASVTIKKYLKNNPETIIALAYFDFDLYEPTKNCLKAILPYLTKGSIIAFDELNLHYFPGETIALKETLGLDKYKIVRSPLNPFASYLIIE